MENFQDKLLTKIKAGEVTMVPRWQFVLRGLLFGVATVVVALIAVYLLSFILFALRESGVVFLPLFGWSGLMLFVVSSPWLLIGMLGIFLCILYLLVSRYAFSYKKPLVYSLVGLVLLVVAISSLIHQTKLHSRAGEFMERNHIPGLSPMYREVQDGHPKDVTRGTVRAVSAEAFQLVTVDGNEYTVVLTDKTKLPADRAIAAGDEVFVFGPVDDAVIAAFGVRFDDGAVTPKAGGSFGPPPVPSY